MMSDFDSDIEIIDITPDDNDVVCISRTMSCFKPQVDDAVIMIDDDNVRKNNFKPKLWPSFSDDDDDLCFIIKDEEADEDSDSDLKPVVSLSVKERAPKKVSS